MLPSLILLLACGSPTPETPAPPPPDPACASPLDLGNAAECLSIEVCLTLRDCGYGVYADVYESDLDLCITSGQLDFQDYLDSGDISLADVDGCLDQIDAVGCTDDMGDGACAMFRFL